MKKRNYLLAGIAALMLASCSTDEQSTGGYVAGSKVTLNASLPNSGTRVNEAASDTYGLITTWGSDDQLDVLVNTNTIVSMTKGDGNTFTATPSDATIGAGFNAGKTIYGVNNKSNDKITTAINGSQLKATVDFTAQYGIVDSLYKYDLMYGKGDPTGKITFNHKTCVMRLDINSDQLKTDGITSITGLKLKYKESSGTKLFGIQEVYNFGATCDSTITDADSIYLQNTSISVADGKATVYVAVPNRQNLYGTLYIKLKGSNGTVCKTYDLTNAISLSNGRMLMSTVHPLAITGLSTPAVNVGDYLFSDGTWSSLANNDICPATPIAVIFSKTTSTTDQGNNWTHGYAMALNNVNSSQVYTWGTKTSSSVGIYYATTAAMIADKDGYTTTGKINNSGHPAAYAAATTYKSAVAAPAGTSGWYLPSIGQWYDIFVNLGKMGSYTDGGTNLYWSGQASTCVTNLNAYLTPTGSTAFTGSDYYWSSSEYNSSGYINSANFGSGNVNLNNYSKSVTTHKVRAVVAF